MLERPASSPGACLAVCPLKSSFSCMKIFFFIFLLATMNAARYYGQLSVCLCPSVSWFSALTFERLDLETSFLVCKYVFSISRPVSYIEVIGSRSLEQKGHMTVTKYAQNRTVPQYVSTGCRLRSASTNQLICPQSERGPFQLLVPAFRMVCSRV